MSNMLEQHPTLRWLYFKRREEQTGKFSSELPGDVTLDKSGGGLTWHSTPEGWSFWDNVLKRNRYSSFTEKYPDLANPMFKVGDKVEVVLPNGGTTFNETGKIGTIQSVGVYGYFKDPKTWTIGYCLEEPIGNSKRDDRHNVYHGFISENSFKLVSDTASESSAKYEDIVVFDGSSTRCTKKDLIYRLRSRYGDQRIQWGNGVSLGNAREPYAAATGFLIYRKPNKELRVRRLFATEPLPSGIPVVETAVEVFEHIEHPKDSQPQSYELDFTKLNKCFLNINRLDDKERHLLRMILDDNYSKVRWFAGEMYSQFPTNQHLEFSSTGKTDDQCRLSTSSFSTFPEIRFSDFLTTINYNKHDKSKTIDSSTTIRAVERRTGEARSSISLGGRGDGLSTGDRKRRTRSVQIGTRKKLKGTGLRTRRRTSRSVTI